ncbi:MAG: hypothetical protein JWR26_514 [Pedosphaera sp.]|nr:hypothetical protein [Pedosphaera sp.]
MKPRSFEVAGLIILLCIVSRTSFGCGPTFPNSFLDGGDAAMLMPPVANFYRELQRMDLGAPTFQAKPATNGYGAQLLEMELADLRSALKKAGLSKVAREEIL